jgi:putative ABC transport system permease protein
MMMTRLSRDLRYAFRVLAKNPGFTMVAVFTIALGIGATTAIFSVVDAVLLRPLPYDQPERLVHLWETNPEEGTEPIPVAPANFLDWRKRSRTMAAFAAYVGPEAGDRSDFNLTGGDRPERIQGSYVSPNLFRLLGVEPALGRTFADDEEGEGRDALVVLGHGLWRRRFGGDPGIVGKTIRLDSREMSVLGVMPEGFAFPTEEVEIWVPFGWDYSPMRQAHIFQAIGRLAPGASLEQARQEMKSIASGLAEEFPDTNTDIEAHLMPLQEWFVGDTRRPLLVLLSAVALVLLIACTNVASLLLARSSVRQREIAIRTALGAGRRQVVRQLLMESLVLSLAGGALGILLAGLGTRLLHVLTPENLQGAGLDWRVLVFATLLSCVSGLLFGLVPALQTSRPNLVESLKGAGKGEASRSSKGSRFRDSLVGLEVALALVVVIAAALLIQSFRRLQEVDPGFEYRNVLTASISLPPAQYSEPAQLNGFLRTALERAGSLPGVVSVGSTPLLPLRGLWWSGDFSVEGQPPVPSGQEQKVRRKEVSPGYFNTLQVPVVAGRPFQDSDDAEAPPVVMVNQTLARRYFGDRSPIGARIKFALASDEATWRTIVGVTADEKQDGIDAEVVPEVYQPYMQRPQNIITLVIRTAGDPMQLAPELQREIRAIDATLPVYDIRPLQDVYQESMARRRLTTLLLSSFAAIALVLSVVGIYGLVSYGVSQRRQEIGIRMALGAQGRDVLGLILKRGMLPVVLGIAGGLAAAFVATSLLASLLFGVESRDPATFLSIPLLLAAVALLACIVPAMRAARQSPGMVLR